ncbi:MAG: J domain-containing protein [Deltaproteobacteria bacterium]|nr:J domain-containing protein [Deltaproteobacteria bacterium]
MENWDQWTERIQRAFEALEKADYYAVLGVVPEADAESIRQAYYNRARQLHPDRLVGAPEPGRSQASTIYKRVSEAYQTLSDPRLRELYDESLEQGETRLTISSRLTLKPRQADWFLRTEGGRKHYKAAREALEAGNVPMAKLNAQIAMRHEGELEQLVQLMEEIDGAG